MDRLKKSAFTKHLLDATDSYLPSVVDPVLRPLLDPIFIFPSGVVLSDIPLATEQKKQAWRIVGMMRVIDTTPDRGMRRGCWWERTTSVYGSS